MSWLKEIEELRRRQAFAEGMGGPEGIARQHRNGKLTARERIDILADPGSFREFMSLRGAGTYENGELTGFTPKASVCGTVELAGRKAFVTAGELQQAAALVHFIRGAAFYMEATALCEVAGRFEKKGDLWSTSTTTGDSGTFTSWRSTGAIGRPRRTVASGGAQRGANQMVGVVTQLIVKR